VRRLRRRRRRAFLAATGLVYLAAVAWLVSPLWRPADAVRPDRAPVSAAADGRAIGIAPLGEPKALPERLPGSPPPGSSTTNTTAASETQGVEPFAEAGAEASTGVPEGSESPVSPPSSGESGEGSHEETIIGFEG
jgi:hypothetical protein